MGWAFAQVSGHAGHDCHPWLWPIGLMPACLPAVCAGVDLDKLVDVGLFISEALGRETMSKTGRAMANKRKAAHNNKDTKAAA